MREGFFGFLVQKKSTMFLTLLFLLLLRYRLVSIHSFIHSFIRSFVHSL